MSSLLSSSDNLTLAQDEIDALWHNINRSPSDPVSHWITIASFIFAILGSISNLMSVIILIRLSSHLSTFVYLSGLSLSDMITCISIIMTHVVEFLVQTRRTTSIVIFLRHVDIIFGALAAGSRVLSLWISTAVTMDRWILICYPIYGKTFCTLNRAKIITRTLFIIAFLYSVPLFFEYEIIQMPSVYQMVYFDNQSLSLMDENFHKNSMLVIKGYSDLAKRRLYRWAYMFFNAIFAYTLPTVIIVFFNIQLIRALRRVKSRTKLLRQKNSSMYKNQRQHRSQQSKYSVTIMVITMVLTLLICRSPTIVIWVLWSFELTIKIFFDSSLSSLVRRFQTIANLIAIINAATNFLPFCVFGQLFRTECLNIYCCRKITHEQFSQKKTEKYEDNKQRIEPNINNPQSTIIKNDHIQKISPLNSEITSSPNHSFPIYSQRNIMKLDDIPYSSNIIEQQQQYTKTPTSTIPLLKETIDL